MDFDPLWAFGGWFLSSSSICMARIHQTPSPLPSPNSSSPSLPTSYDQSINKATKLHSLLLFCALLFLFILLAHPSHHYHDHDRHGQLQPNSVSPKTTAQALDPSRYHSSSTSFANTRSSSASTKSDFWPGRAPKHVATASSSSTQREFEASAHEVPSGPNPISN